MEYKLISKAYITEVSLNREMVESFEHYPFSLTAVRSLESLELHPKVTFFVGENGAGKSTLLEAMAVASGFNAEGGSKNFNFQTRESHSPLHGFLKIARGISRPKDGFFFRAESFFNVATEVENLGMTYGGHSLHEQSHGEAFLSLILHRFKGNGLYLLDEPEAALSPQRQLAVLARIHELVAQKSQWIIATHSPILMAYPDAFIYEFSEKGIQRVAYHETENYQITRNFLADPSRMLEILFNP